MTEDHLDDLVKAVHWIGIIIAVVSLSLIVFYVLPKAIAGYEHDKKHYEETFSKPLKEI